MSHWRVETRVTVKRVYFVSALNEKEAEGNSIFTAPSHEEDENEETMSVIEVSPETLYPIR